MKVGYLPKHLAVWADAYGLCAHVVKIYSAESEVTANRQKFHRNKGCCVALIIDAGIDVVGGDVECSKEEMVIWMSMMESRRDDDAIQRRRMIAFKRLFSNYEGS